MTFTQRISLFFKGRMDGLLESLEDPERSLNQLVIEMEQQLEAAKRAAARARANEKRLGQRIDTLRREADEFETGARRALTAGKEDTAREYLERAEQNRQRAEELGRQLADQERDSERIRQSMERISQQVEEARSRQQLLLARLRQGEARRAMGKVVRGASASNLAGELERLSDRLELDAAEESAYLEIDDHLSGDDLRRQRDAEALSEAVDDRLAALRADLATEGEPAAGKPAEESP